MYVLAKVLHDWDNDAATRILSKIRAATADHARLLIIDSVVPAGNSPHPSKATDLVMLSLVDGRERSEDEWAATARCGRFSASQHRRWAHPGLHRTKRPGRAHKLTPHLLGTSPPMCVSVLPFGGPLPASCSVRPDGLGSCGPFALSSVSGQNARAGTSHQASSRRKTGIPRADSGRAKLPEGVRFAAAAV